MRIRIFKSTNNDGKSYWTYTTRAYKHEDCKLMWFVKFTKKCIEPIAQKGYSNQREYEYADIDIQECALENTTEYNGKINPIITIFAYTEVKSAREEQETRVEASDMKEVEKVNSTLDKAKEFAEDNNVPLSIDISSDNLPFY